MSSNIKKRSTKQERISNETNISLSINLDGSGKTKIDTGFGLLDHMLELMAFWANIDLSIKCSGDMNVDAHHTVEDVGLILGASILKALGDKKGINRVGYGRVPMDESLCEVTIDLSGRPWLEWRGDKILPPILANEEKDVWREFYKAFASTTKCNLHIEFLYGKNGHHLLESVAKGLGIALSQAISINSSKIRSTKGGLD